MTKKLSQNQQEKVKTGFWLLSQNKIVYFLFYLLILFLPTQFGKHFWPNFSFVSGLRLDYLSPTLYLTDVFILLLFVFYFSKLKSILIKINKKYLLSYILFLAVLIIGVAGSKNPLAGFYGIVKFLEYTFLTLFVIIHFKYFNKTVLAFCFLAGIIFESSLSFLQYFNQGSIGGIFYFFGERAFTAQTPGIANASINGQLFLRPYATFSHPNVLAGFLIIAMLYALLLFKNKIKTLVLIGIILGSASLLLSLSRTAIILWIAYLIILFGIPLVKKYKNRFSKSKLIATVVVLFVIALCIFIFFRNSFILQRSSLTKITEEAILQRAELIQQSLVMFMKNPIFGVGVNNFYNNLSFANSRLTVSLIQPVHNIFLLALSETGIIGFCLFVYLFYVSIKNLIYAKFIKQRKFLLMMIFAIIFLGSFDHYFLTIQQGQILFAIIFGTIFSYGKSLTIQR
jgi:O-antigen ligase